MSRPREVLWKGRRCCEVRGRLHEPRPRSKLIAISTNKGGARTDSLKSLAWVGRRLHRALGWEVGIGDRRSDRVSVSSVAVLVEFKVWSRLKTPGAYAANRAWFECWSVAICATCNGRQTETLVAREDGGLPVLSQPRPCSGLSGCYAMTELRFGNDPTKTNGQGSF